MACRPFGVCARLWQFKYSGVFLLATVVTLTAFVLLTMFVAIIDSAFLDAKKKTREGAYSGPDMLWLKFLRIWWAYLRELRSLSGDWSTVWRELRGRAKVLVAADGPAHGPAHGPANGRASTAAEGARADGGESGGQEHAQRGGEARHVDAAADAEDGAGAAGGRAVQRRHDLKRALSMQLAELTASRAFQHSKPQAQAAIQTQLEAVVKQLQLTARKVADLQRQLAQAQG